MEEVLFTTIFALSGPSGVYFVDLVLLVRKLRFMVMRHPHLPSRRLCFLLC